MSTKVIAVIHHRDLPTTIENAAIAKEAGAAGVALIEMNGEDEALDEPCRVLRLHYEQDGRFLVSANRLATSAADAVLINANQRLDFTWVDDPGVYSSDVNPTADEITRALEVVDGKRPPGRPKHLLFGGVAFKSQRREPDPAEAAIRAANMGWVVTTSGTATGVAPSLSKLSVMRRAIGDHPMAVASGVAPDNVSDIAAYVDYLLVATGVSYNFYELDFQKLSVLVSRARQYGRGSTPVFPNVQPRLFAAGEARAQA